MRFGDQRRSGNIEDRRGQRASGGGMRGGLPISTRGMSLPTLIVIGLVLAGVYFFAPASIKEMVFGAGGASQGVSGGEVAAGQCPAGDAACDGVSAVLGSTEDIWTQQFSEGRLPTYGGATLGAYEQPTLVLFEEAVDTACGTAPSSVGPFYCPTDRKLYIDLSFYEVLAQRLNAPGDFAQAYVIAHEVGHHVQNLIGATQVRVGGENQNQTSVRVELQADCLAGVWGHTAQASLAIDEADLREALNAAHSIGDDTLQQGSQGYVNPEQFTHGTSAQRVRWFRRGFDTGDARQCDTFAVDAGRL
jgi:uncharacterized protein